MISGIVLARNEERNIVKCLETLRPHVAEILLIDMESSDRTVELARPYVSKVLHHPQVANFDGARNLAVPEAQHDWLWFVDADERISWRTGDLVNRLLRDPGYDFVALSIPFKSYFGDKWIEHCGWWPGYTMPRVLRRGTFRFAERLHGGVQVEGPELRVAPHPEFAIEHFSYRSVEHYIEKVNRYTSTEATQMAQDGRQWDWQRAMRHMVHDLWLYYERNLGHLDGRHGWILSWLSGQYRWLSHAKLLDQANGHSGPAATQNDSHASAPASLDEVMLCMQDELARLRTCNPQPPLGIVWRSPIWDPSGYADEGRTFVKALARGNRTLKLEDLRWSSEECELSEADASLLTALTRVERPKHTATITDTIPLTFRHDPCAALNILRTTFETDRIPDYWHEWIEQADEVWVISEFNRRSFRRAGVAPEKIRVVPSCIDTDLYHPDGEPLELPRPLQGRFVFLSIFDWALRKGWDLLLRAYCEEFRADEGVGLLLKITRSHSHPSNVVVAQANELLSEIGQSLAQRPDIVLSDAVYSGAQMAALYRAADAFVLPTRGEGWGRPYMEAMASGLPTIGTGASGNIDFMNDSNSFLIPAREVDIPEQAALEIPVYRGHCWFEPDSRALRKLLREVFTDKAQRAAKAKQGLLDVRSRFGLNAGREAIEQALEAAESRFVRCNPAPPRPDQIRVEWEGEFFAGHSFSHINEQLAMELSKDESLALALRRVVHYPPHPQSTMHRQPLELLMQRTFEGGPEVTVRHAYPPHWEPPASGFWIHIQPFEFGHLPADWVAPLRDLVDEIWAPSQYVKKVYERSGISPEKIHVIPWGLDPAVFSPDAPPLILPTSKSFRFLYVGGTIPRKGFDRLLRAYLDEFGPDDDVCLVIKDMGADSFYLDCNHRREILAARDDGRNPQVLYLDRFFTAGQLASLYTACDCLAAPYRGEGFGLPVLEAMACALAPIVPRNGATDDFVSETTAVLLPSQEIETSGGSRLCGPAMELDIDQTDLRQALRHAYEHAEEIRGKGRVAAERVLDSFLWMHTARSMVERLQSLVGKGHSRAAQDHRHSPAGGDVQASGQPGICAVVSADNHESSVGSCLARLQSRVSEVRCLLDGSTDRTRRIVEEYGGVVCNRENDSTASARQVPQAEWLLYLRGDELLEEEQLDELLAALAAMPVRVTGAAIRTAFHDHEGRLVASQPEIRVLRRGRLGGLPLLPLHELEPLLAFQDGLLQAIDVSLRSTLPAYLRSAPWPQVAKAPEPWLAPWTPAGGEVFLDIGANVGDWSKSLAEGFDKVYAIEPNPEAIGPLRAGLPKNVLVKEFAAWSAEESRRFATFESSAHLSAYFDQEGINTGIRTGAITLPCRPLDSLKFAGRVSFLKCDTEGAEVHVLRGARELVARDRPVMMVEVHSRENLRSAMELLNQWHYRFVVIRHPQYPLFSRFWFDHSWLCCWPRRSLTPISA